MAASLNLVGIVGRESDCPKCIHVKITSPINYEQRLRRNPYVACKQ